MTIEPRYFFTISLLLLVLLGGLQLATGAFGPSDPLFAAGCGSCHLAGDKVNASNANLLFGPEEQLCLSCHTGAVQASHPSGVSPSMEVPAVFPLDWKGDMTCSSCHLIHQDDHGALRDTDRGKPFCGKCHDQGFFERMADGGGSLVISGHLDASPEPDQLGLDPYSVQCMGCHDDKAEDPRQVVHIDPQQIVRHGSGSNNHPVGIRYADVIDNSYRPEKLLPAAVVLPDGMVSCISCHRSYSSDHGAMVVTQKGSSLCFQCHDL